MQMSYLIPTLVAVIGTLAVAAPTTNRTIAAVATEPTPELTTPLSLNETMVSQQPNHHASKVWKRGGTFTRCPRGQKAVTKSNNKAPGSNGCGVGALAGHIPGATRFDECCDVHDHCFGRHLSLSSNFQRPLLHIADEVKEFQLICFE